MPEGMSAHQVAPGSWMDQRPPRRRWLPTNRTTHTAVAIGFCTQAHSFLVKPLGCIGGWWHAKSNFNLTAGKMNQNHKLNGCFVKMIYCTNFFYRTPFSVPEYFCFFLR